MLALLVLAGSLKSLQIEIGLIFHFLSLPFPSLKIRDKWFTRDKTCRITEEKPLRVIPVIIYQLWSEQCIVVIVSYSVFSISWLFPLERKVFEKGEWGGGMDDFQMSVFLWVFSLSFVFWRSDVVSKISVKNNFLVLYYWIDAAFLSFFQDDPSSHPPLCNLINRKKKKRETTLHFAFWMVLGTDAGLSPSWGGSFLVIGTS